MIGRKQQVSLETFIGQDSIIKGEVISKGVVRIEGTVEGNTQADSIVVGRSGAIRGDVSVKRLEVDGTVEGNVTAMELVEIHSAGSIEGDVRTVKLIVADGAFFAGHSYMQRPGTVVEEAEEIEEEVDADGKKKVERIF